jgi:hypothetical protein
MKRSRNLQVAMILGFFDFHPTGDSLRRHKACSYKSFTGHFGRNRSIWVFSDSFAENGGEYFADGY